jgi:hypothetical protein
MCRAPISEDFATFQYLVAMLERSMPDSAHRSTYGSCMVAESAKFAWQAPAVTDFTQAQAYIWWAFGERYTPDSARITISRLRIRIEIAISGDFSWI